MDATPLAALAAPPPPDALAGPALDAWAAARARRLLTEVALVCGGRRHRLREVELYLQCPAHPDPFVHGAEHQQRAGGWYFHRAGRSYRGGTFKGLDFSTGGPGVGCGWLLRSVEVEGGPLVDGSCTVVDHLLAVAGLDAIAPLDRASPDALDPASALHLAPIAPEPDAPPMLCTPRVGLTLKRAAQHPTMPRYIGLRRRYLTLPGRIAKGRIQTIAARLAAGDDVDAIHRLTGSPRRAIERAAAAYAEGRGADPAAFGGRALSAAALYRLYGAWDARYG